MNQSFQHIKQAIKFVMFQYELPQEEATNFVLEYMSQEGNNLMLDISPLAFGTYGHN